MLLNRMKVLLGIADNKLLTDNNDELLMEILDITKSKILNYINSSELPKELEFVLIELAIQRYNKIGSEGIASESVDGRTTSYESYKQYLDDYINKNKMVKGFRLIWGLIL